MSSMKVSRRPPTLTSASRSKAGQSVARPRSKGAVGVQPKSPAWARDVLRADPGARVTVQSLTSPKGTLHGVLGAAGVDVTTGRSYQPALLDRYAKNAGGPGGPFIPVVMYKVDDAQLAALEKSFPLGTQNGVSTALGQTDNRGLLTDEAFVPGTRTLWRMAVYPVEGQPGQHLVGFYGEALPDWSEGQGLVKVGGQTLPLRVGLDTRVGQKPGPVAQWVDGWVRRLGLDTGG